MEVRDFAGANEMSLGLGYLPSWNHCGVARKTFLPRWSRCPAALLADLEDPDSIRSRNRRREGGGGRGAGGERPRLPRLHDDVIEDRK